MASSQEAEERLRSALADRYTIEREIGSGGMATVYLAQDLKHDRKVAVKVLKPELAAVVGTERFLAEIRTTANLSHPHILPLFDSGEADGFLFYVMPLVEGDSLRERLDRDGQLSTEEALRIAGHVADALDYAHRQGVIHRDIKPANILFEDDQPVVTDFGIALAVSAAGEGRLTETGLSLGTPYYMSPEQAVGDQAPTAASDVYSLGCVLYEILTGDPPHTGSSAQAILGKILLGEVTRPTTLRRTIPAHVEGAILKSLERLPVDRFGSLSELGAALRDPSFRHRAEAEAEVPRDARTPMVLSVFVAILALALGVSLWQLLSPEPQPVARFELMLKESRSFGMAAFGDVEFALSSDGSRIVYVGASPTGESQLWQRHLENLDAIPVPGTEGARSPALSPDGQSVAFEVAGAIKSARLQGGPLLTVAPRGSHPAWGSDGKVYFSRDGTLHGVAETGGGEVEPLTSPTDGSQLFFEVLPGGRGFLMTVVKGFMSESRIGVVGPDGGEVREMLNGTMARYAESGHILYTTADGVLMGAPFDLGSLEVTDSPVPLVEGIEVSDGSATQFAVSKSGVLLYRTRPLERWEMEWVSRTGEAEPVDTAWTGDFMQPALSPDGSQVAVTLRTGWSISLGETQDIWIKQLDEGPSHKLTFEGSNRRPEWTSDGSGVTYSSDRGGNPGETDLWTKPADGSGEATLELDADRDVLELQWSSDGEWLVYRTTTLDRGLGDILVRSAGEDAEHLPLVATEFSERHPALSPNGGWLAYTSNETGRDEVFVIPFPEGGGRWAVSSAGGSEPLWAHSGRELFYRSGDGSMVAVPVETEGTFSFGAPRVLFSALDFRVTGYHPNWDVAPDDERFIMVRRLGDEVPGRVILVQNFFTELEDRVGGGD